MQHGRVLGRRIGTLFVRQGQGVRIEVHDCRGDQPQLRAALPSEETGRGLALVDAITEQQWGVEEREGPGKSVWALVVPPYTSRETGRT
jgi:hypothetical protein